MELLLPEFGLVIWTSIAFLIVIFLLAKFAWKPILNSIKERENFISTSLENANNAQNKIQNIQIETQQLLKEAQLEKIKIIAEGQSMKNNIINEATEKAKIEANKILMSGKADMAKQQEKAMLEIKKEVANLIIATTEKILQEKLKTNKEQEKIIEKAIEELTIN